MLHIQCNQCGAWEVTEDGADPDVAITCGCCTQDHHHGNAASCPGNHTACPEPKTCSLWASVKANVAALTDEHPEHAAVKARFASAPGDCPGGHCGAGVDGCTVCRPLTITMLRGSVSMQPARPGA